MYKDTLNLNKLLSNSKKYSFKKDQNIKRVIKDLIIKDSKSIKLDLNLNRSVYKYSLKN